VRERPSTYRAIQVICENSRARQKKFGIRVREELVLRVATGEQTFKAAMKHALISQPVSEVLICYCACSYA
jgi:hypothetical protein